nr:peptidylprolyl isomerase [Bacteroidota bacterium]
MQIQKDKVVSMHYTLKDDNGTILDSSVGKQTLNYIHGHGNLIPGLEDELEGKVKEVKLNVTIPPEKAYGLKQEEMLIDLDRSSFENPENVQPGMQFQAQFDNGTQLLTVVGVTDDKVKLDGNHPLAGQTLHFDVEIMDVRDASAEEMNHGHVHGEGGHHH